MRIRGGKSYRQHTSFKRFIRERDNYTCQICGDYGDQVDHIIPYSECHETRPENCRVLCRSCNLRRAETAKHLNGENGARMRSWERKADPEGIMAPAERLAAAKELQREHLARIARARAESSEAEPSPMVSYTHLSTGGLNVSDASHTNAVAGGSNEKNTRAHDLAGQPQERRRATATGWSGR